MRKIQVHITSSSKKFVDRQILENPSSVSFSDVVSLWGLWSNEAKNSYKEYIKSLKHVNNNVKIYSYSTVENIFKFIEDFPIPIDIWGEKALFKAKIDWKKFLTRNFFVYFIYENITILPPEVILLFKQFASQEDEINEYDRMGMIYKNLELFISDKITIPNKNISLYDLHSMYFVSSESKEFQTKYFSKFKINTKDLDYDIIQDNSWIDEIFNIDMNNYEALTTVCQFLLETNEDIKPLRNTFKTRVSLKRVKEILTPLLFSDPKLFKNIIDNW